MSIPSEPAKGESRGPLTSTRRAGERLSYEEIVIEVVRVRRGRVTLRVRRREDEATDAPCAPRDRAG